MANSSGVIPLLIKSMDAVSKTNAPSEIDKIIVDLLKEFTKSDIAELFVFDSVRQVLHTMSQNPLTVSMVEAKGLIGESFLTKKSNFYNHLASEKYYDKEVDNPYSTKVKSQMIIPIVEDDSLLGMIRVSRAIHNRDKYTIQEFELIKSLVTFLIKIIYIMKSDTVKGRYDSKVITDEVINTENNLEKSSSNDEMMLYFSNTVHDIRTPSNSLYGFLELLEEEIKDKRIRGFIQNAKESALFINELTSSILNASKDRFVQNASSATNVHTTKFFAQIANSFSANIAEKDINYLIYIDPKIPKEISIDEIKLKRILINLLGNAYKFTPVSKKIVFAVKYDEVNIALDISVLDTGVGIAKDSQKNIFEPYKQAEDDTSEKFGGTGLGLSICAKYVEELGSKLKLESEIDKGSRFYFTMPIKIVDETPSFENFVNLDKRITILTNNPECIDAKNIKEYISELGLPPDMIQVKNTIAKDATHIICFQHKITDKLLEFTLDNKINLMLVEEKLFSLGRDSKTAKYNIISKNTYYGDMVHEFLFYKKKRNILLVDDNKINLILLEVMLEAEHVNIVSTDDGYAALELLEEAHNKKQAFDVIFMDEHMPSMCGTDVINIFRSFEKENNFKPILAISITGDPSILNDNSRVYDKIVKKPFSKADVLGAIA